MFLTLVNSSLPVYLHSSAVIVLKLQTMADKEIPMHLRDPGLLNSANSAQDSATRDVLSIDAAIVGSNAHKTNVLATAQGTSN